MEIDADALNALPEDGVPEGMVQAAVPSSINVAREEGPADSTSRDASSRPQVKVVGAWPQLFQ